MMRSPTQLPISRRAWTQVGQASDFALESILRALPRSEASAVRNGDVKTQGEDEQGAQRHHNHSNEG